LEDLGKVSQRSENEAVIKNRHDRHEHTFLTPMRFFIMKKKVG